jgi:hypothetical protein
MLEALHVQNISGQSIYVSEHTFFMAVESALIHLYGQKSENWLASEKMFLLLTILNKSQPEPALKANYIRAILKWLIRPIG